MQFQFEIFALGDRLSAEQWSTLYASLAVFLGNFGKFELYVTCRDNVLRYFVACNRDVGKLSNTLDGMLLRPVDASELSLPTAHRKEHNVQFVTGGNLLDLKEKYAVKKAKDLQVAQFRVSALGKQKAIVTIQLFFTDAAGQWLKATKVTTFLPVSQLAVDFAGNSRYLKRTLPRYLSLEKSLHLMTSDRLGALFKVDTFPYFSHDMYLSLNSYDFDRH